MMPEADEMLATLVSLVPRGGDEAFRIVVVGAGDGMLAAALLDCFPAATLLGLEETASMRERATRRLGPFGERASIRSFQLATLDWWDLMRGAGVVVSTISLHRLNDSKKQYLFRAAAERVAEQGALLVADRVQPQHPIARRLAPASDGASPLFFQLVWLKHAGFPIADCFWAAAGHAVYGGFKTAAASGSAPLTYQVALDAIRRHSRSRG
jgi:trans-aconitate methyltransferase